MRSIESGVPCACWLEWFTSTRCYPMWLMTSDATIFYVVCPALWRIADCYQHAVRCKIECYPTYQLNIDYLLMNICGVKSSRTVPATMNIASELWCFLVYIMCQRRALLKTACWWRTRMWCRMIMHMLEKFLKVCIVLYLARACRWSLYALLSWSPQAFRRHHVQQSIMSNSRESFEVYLQARDGGQVSMSSLGSL